jgi:hypothetical protein
MAWRHKSCEKLVVCKVSKITADRQDRYGYRAVEVECPLCGDKKEYVLDRQHVAVCNGLVILQYNRGSLKERDLLRLDERTPNESIQ